MRFNQGIIKTMVDRTCDRLNKVSPMDRIAELSDEALKNHKLIYGNLEKIRRISLGLKEEA